MHILLYQVFFLMNLPGTGRYSYIFSELICVSTIIPKLRLNLMFYIFLSFLNIKKLEMKLNFHLTVILDSKSLSTIPRSNPMKLVSFLIVISLRRYIVICRSTLWYLETQLLSVTLPTCASPVHLSLMSLNKSL